MPEYLAPGVYVEEVDTGSKPIEGVSTSTSGMVGVTEWGPEKIVTLVTGWADFQRQFGGYLDKNFYNGAWYLPHAVEGFFTNGGKRLYIVRVLPKAATPAITYLVDRPTSDASLKATLKNKLSKSNEITLDAGADQVLTDSVFKLDDGQFAEYVRAAENGDAATQVVKLESSPYRDHDQGATFESRDSLLKIQAIDRGAWGNTLQITPDDDESLLETSVAADAAANQAKVILNITQGIEPGSIIEFFIEKVVSEYVVILTAALGKTIKRGTRIRLKTGAAPNGKFTDWETVLTQDAKVTTDNFVSLESAEKLKTGSVVELLFDDGSTEDRIVDSIKITLDKAIGEALTAADTVVSARGARVDAKLTADLTGTETTINLDQGAGIRPGATLIFRIFQEKVVSVDKKVLTVDGTLDKDVKAGWLVRTREFKLRVDSVQFNPVTKQSRVVLSETHRHLTLDPRHSRYVVRVIGSIIPGNNIPLRADGRTEGESQLIRVEDMFTEDKRISDIRVGPELILGSPPIPLHLTGGDDAITTLSDIDYIGNDDINPLLRSGLQSLKNVTEISIVAIPGRTAQRVQEAVINHCELLRYRFAVIDSRENDKIAQVQEHRQNYDTKYAAFYYPWLEISDPFPDNPRTQGNVSIPPSGHMMGIYARSDIERGVFKAPANEVIRGIADLEVKLMKEHQDILNPRNINVLRNFREDNRGLRVWGARTLSSDPDWKYVNVRRLFIFIEKSIDQGTQWVVFEPNDEQLWARVKRVISAFLTQVWRDGALMGLKPEQAFFVKCDRTTMTQNDIDNGRLIVLIGIAPVKPAEFVIFRIGQWTGGAAQDN
jgi:uncharacterized protein